MTKKNIRPQQVAPVARETNSTSKDQNGKLSSSTYVFSVPTYLFSVPFAGDDAE